MIQDTRRCPASALSLFSDILSNHPSSLQFRAHQRRDAVALYLTMPRMISIFVVAVAVVVVVVVATMPIWPLQDILLLRVVCARTNHPLIPSAHLHCPHCYSTIARLEGHIRPPLDLPFVCHTPSNIGSHNIV